MRPNKYLHDTFIHNTNAAEKVVPFLIELFNPASVIDVGCGTGTWLKVCQQNGINKIHGIEGPHLDLSKLVIPREFVLLQDLESPFALSEKFDMAISLEVAEHLNGEIEDQFIGQLTLLSDVVIFSAAIPFQGGQNHINEQWFSYWVALFKKFNFYPFDVIRPKFWTDPKVEFWYAQNCCIFIKDTKKYEHLAILPTFLNKDIVHPELLKKLGEYKQQIWNAEISYVSIVKLFIKKMRNSFRRFF